MDSKKIRKIKTKNFFLLLLLAITGGLLFALANPNPLIKEGWGFIGWFMYVPYLFLIKKSFLKNSWFYSGLYGTLCVCLYAYWLYNYDPLCLYIAIPIGFLATAILGLALKSIEKLFVKNAWLIQFLLLCSFEYLRTLGFLGIHYGLAAYTQWKFNSLIQISSVTGVFGLNAIVIFSSVIIFTFISKIEDKKYFMHKMISDDEHYEGATYINYVSENSKSLKKASLKIPIIAFSIWALLLIGIIVQGTIKLNKNQDYETITAVAVQHADDPDSNGMENFSESLHTLMNLTDEAFEMNSQIKLVIWPETAIVPSILYHYNQEGNSDRKKLVTYVLEYFNKHDASFIIGNQHIEVKETTGEKIYYNSALLFDKDCLFPPKPQLYNKIHLVPFSETFPYQKYFPHIYKAILEKQKFFSEPGDQIKLLNTRGLDIYTPICFENTFPDLCRKACKKGARALVCLVNDSWSKSQSCQYQHLAMAKFRAVENHVPLAISAVSGQTAFIDPNGQIMAMALPFTKSYVICDFPILKKGQNPCLYNKIGDLCGYGFAFLLLLALLIRCIIAIINKVLWQNAQKQ